MWGCLMATETLPVIDGLITATALSHKFTVATPNVGDFKQSKVKLVNPFE
jgi:toxin FitB